MYLWVCAQVQAKSLKGRTVTGVAAGRFHTVLWTKEAVYTMGLNGGQLGKLEACCKEDTALERGYFVTCFSHQQPAESFLFSL